MKKIYSTKSVIILALGMLFAFAPVKNSLYAQYCVPLLNCLSGDQIQNVIMPDVGIEHLNTGCSPAGYGNFTGNPDLHGFLIPGETYSFTINVGPTWSQGIAIYIDFEGNESFTDPGNLVATSPSAINHTGTFTVPLTVTPGETRMRVICAFATIPGVPCPQTNAFGEAHDYLVLIAPAIDCQLNCPDNIVANTDPGQCGASLSIPLPTLTGDECPPASDMVNDFNGGNNASGFYPVGSTTVNYNFPGTSAIPCSFTVEVIDNQAPVFTNCQDYTFTLPAGECGIIFNFELNAEDNCPPIASSVAGAYCDPCEDATGGSALACAPFAQNAIISFIDLPSAGFIENFCFNQETFGNAEPATIHFYGPQAAGVVPYIGGGFTPFYSIDYQTVAADDGTCVCVDFPEPVDVPAGGVWVEVWTPGATLNSRVVQTPATCDGNNGTGLNTYLQAPACGFLAPVTFASIGFFLDAGFTLGFSTGDLVGEPDPGAPAGTNQYVSGDVLPIGEHCFVYTASDAAGNQATCEFCVTVNEFPNPTSALACNDRVNISLDENCEAHINADMILEGGPYACYDNYLVEIEDQFGNFYPSNPFIGECNILGEQLKVTVTGPNGNKCWGYLVIEDKIAPELECRDIVVACGEAIPQEPAPGVSGPQSIIFDGLTDVVGVPNNPAEVEYEFDFNYLPVDATIEDVDVRIKVQHTWATDMTIQVESPSGTVVSVFNVTGGGGCLAANITIDVTFDDGGADIGNCNGLNLGGAPVRPMMGGSMHFNGLEAFAGEDARGTWTVRFLDNVFGDDGNIEIAGLILFVDAETIDPADNCGDVDLSFTEVIVPGTCDDEFSSQIIRNWRAEDCYNNVSTCEQTISIERTTLEEFEFPGSVTLDCSDFPAGEVPGPDFTGSPSDLLCGSFVTTFTDIVVPDCGNARKILRTWTIIDWCTGEVLQGSQIIKIMDNDEPEFGPGCDAPRSISTDINNCSRLLYFVPVPEITDECSDNVSYTVSSTGGVVSLDNQGRWIIQNIPAGTHVVTYTANDGCDNEATCSFELSVVDDVAPVAICDIDTRVSLGSDGNALVHWTAFDDGSYDNCGIAEIGLQRDISNPGGRAGCGNSPGAQVWVPQLNFCCDDLTRSPILVNVRVVDVNGNINICQVEVYVEDRLAPVVQCPAPVEVDLNCLYNFGEVVWGAQIGNDNAANVSADALNNIELFGEQFGRIARTQAPFNEIWRDFEINPTGNPNSQTRIGINDGYAVDNCPTSGDGLRVFETYRITVDPQCGNVGTSVSQLNPFKGNLAIERNFYVIDGQGNGSNPPNAGFGNPNTASCTQRIYVTNNNPFQGLTLMQWQNNALGQANVVRTIAECGGDEPDLDEVGQIDKTRILNYINNRPDAACANLLVGYTDMNFEIVQDACFKILRQWKVIDWCQHDPNSGAGEWTFFQTIKVMDTAGPDCDGCGERDIEITDGINCSGFVDFEVEFSDGCTPDDMLGVRFQIDAFNNGSFDIDESYTGAANASRANRVLPFGDHRIRWTLSDMCGNTSVFEYEFSVVDAKKPTPVCLNGIATVVMPTTASITIPASDFDVASFDDCTTNDNLIFSYTSDTDSLTRTWDCDDLEGEQERTFRVEIWVTDEAGNQDWCETYILIQDNMNVCPDTASGTATISGLIVNETNTGVENVDVTFSATYGGFAVGQNTPNNGSFSFANVPMAQEYQLEGVRNDNPLNGVTTYDIALIQRHILGSQLLDSPYKLIAADVNNDGNINVIDVAQLRRLILGTYSEFPNSDSWKVVVDEQLEMGITPPAHNTVMDLGLVNRDMLGNNFIGVKMGDVNASHKANGLDAASERSLAESLELRVAERQLTAGEQVVVEVTSENIEGIFGYQGTINFNRNALDFVGYESGIIQLSDANFGFHLLSEGMITTSWSETGAIENGNGVLFSLVFEVVGETALSQSLSFTSNQTVAEAYNDNGVMGVEMVFEGSAVRGENFALYQNTPNPFNGETVIGFVLPEASDATITIFDVTGKVVRVIEGSYAAGYSEVPVSRNALGAAGVYYYQLDTENHTATKKMIFMD